MWISYNSNPDDNNVGDCTIRAISEALSEDWSATYINLAVQGLVMSDMPSSNKVWAAYLRKRGFSRHIIPNDCPDNYTVADFCRDNPRGVFLLALDKHVVCVKNGDWIDTWDSGGETPVYYWCKDH